MELTMAAEESINYFTDMVQWEKETTAFLTKIGQIQPAVITKKDEA
jgi:hypothetical protein